GDAATNFRFVPSGFTNGNFDVAELFVKDGGSQDSCTGLNCLQPDSSGKYKITEDGSFTPNYTLTDKVCKSSDPLRQDSDPTTGIPLVGGETVTCTFTNTKNAPSLSIDKVATETSYSAVGQVIHYTIK